MATDSTEQKSDTGNQIDMSLVASFGDELWTKKQVPFDHVTMDVRAHVLVCVGDASNPGRKLCFNTYNGTLGKNKKLDDMCLPDFRNNDTPSDGKKRWHILRVSIDKARDELTRKGYERV